MRRLSLSLAVGTALFFPTPVCAFFGTELAPLLELVAGQVAELEKLTQTLGLAKESATYLRQLNEGIERTVDQIRSLQALLERAQGLDPKGVRSLADLNELLRKASSLKADVETLLQLKVDLAEQAIDRSALQSDTTYKMGQEMVATGAKLATESQAASPGRATQITAAASSAQMLSQGVELQTLAQVVELQALLLDFHKSQVARELQAEKARRRSFEQALGKGRRK